MYEDNKRFSLTNFFVKVIIVIIFVLFVIWLLSLSTKKMTNSLDVLTDNIFAQNIQKMKEAGKEYFTTERLPEEVGDIKTLSLQKMYDRKLLLTLKDKNGNKCSSEDSYVSVEKLESEYQMKVYLKCGEESDYIIVIMGCYNYCKTDICEVNVEENKQIEYEYKKTTGGYWTNYGAWSDWSKVSVSSNNNRKVETKKVTEEYTYDKQVTEYTNVSYTATCPTGYTLSNGKCVKNYSQIEYSDDLTCPTKSGYSVTRNGSTCIYTKSNTSTASFVCPEKTGYTSKLNGTTCTYTKPSTSTVSFVCPEKSGYTSTLNGTVCTYTKSNTVTTNPTCPTKSGYSVTRNGSVCVYTKPVTSTSSPQCNPTYGGGTYSSIVGFTCYYKVSTQSCKQVAYQVLESPCATCGSIWVTKYKDSCTTNTSTVSTSAFCKTGYTNINGVCTKTTPSTLTEDAKCPTGYNLSNGMCTNNTPITITGNAECPTGSTNTNGKCVVTTPITITGNAECPTGYTNSNGVCSKTIPSTLKEDAVCPTGYSLSGSRCARTVPKTDTKSTVNTCPTGSSEKADKTGCVKPVTKTVKQTGSREVTLYRFCTRSYVGGTTDYKWSTSKDDKKLINAGYVLTGKTRNS